MIHLSKSLGWRVLCAATAAGLFVLAGCQPAAPAPPEPTQTPTMQSELPEAQPTATPPDLETGYPEPAQPPAAATPAESYPVPEGDGPGGPGGGPVRPNGSRVTAELIETAPYEANPALVRLRIKLLASEAMEGMPSMTDELVNQEIDMLIEAARLPDLQAGDIFEAEVAYLGDEHGANYHILNILKKVD